MGGYQLRRERMLQVVAEEGYASVEELRQRLAISAMTVRRDLQHLEDEGLVRRTHGGVTLAARPNEPGFGDRSSAFLPQKRAIGRAASELVSDGQTVILDAGTTVLEVARQLSWRNGLTLITNSLRVLEALSRWPDVTIVSTGGKLKHQELALVGPSAERSLQERHADIAFCSAAGFSVEYGATDYEETEVAVKRTMLTASARTYLVVDSSKAGLVSPMVISPLAAYHGIVTDDSLSDDLARNLRNLGLQLVIAPSLVDAVGIAE